jgi:hypothetical protein
MVRVSVGMLKSFKTKELNADFFLNLSKVFDPIASLHSFNYQIPAEELKVSLRS